MRTEFDAIIVGAGPAGATAAILLARAGWSVALVEKQRFPRRKVCGECIAESNLPLLSALGIGAWQCDVRAVDCADLLNLRAPVLIDAHGSWEALATNPAPQRVTHRGSDLLAFKANFQGAKLAQGLLPVLLFEGGYGGMVTAGEATTTVAGCIRRDQLEALRAARPGLSAGDTFEAMLRRECAGVRHALRTAVRNGPWLAAGPRMYNAPAAWIGMEYQWSGPNLTYTTACSSSAVAIGEAWLRVASGALDFAIAGGAEAPLSLGSLKAWEALHTLATTDTGHITRPSVEGQANAMRAALASAACTATDIDAISATKAMHGHLLGAAGALECVLSLLAMQYAVDLPTLNLRIPDPACDLDYVPNVVRDNDAVRTMLSNSFAFGGTNAVLVLGAARAGR